MSDQSLLGNQFNQYQLLQEIGRSRTAVVYRALQPSVNRQVAIKLISADLARRADFRQRFEAEMKRLAGLEHFNIQAIYGVGIEGEIPYIVMRYLSGGSLAGVLERQKVLSPDVTVALADQIAAGLDYAHGQGIAHRDLKPSNILFDGQGNAYLTDFGLSWLLAAGNPTTASGDIGTPSYLSPEVASGMTEVGPSTDIYALGVILFEALTGRPPFTGAHPLQVARKHLSEQPPTPTSINPHLPQRVDAVILTALAKRPENRYPTAGALAEALGEACGTEPGMTTVVGIDGFLSVAEADVSTARLSQDEVAEAQEAQRPARRANEWMLFAGIATLLVLGILALGGFLLSRLAGQGGLTPVPSLASLGEGSQTPTIEATEASTAGATAPPAAVPTSAATPRPTTGAPGGGGGKIAYISERTGNPELYILDLTTNALTQVTHNTGKISAPAWSPDGKWLAYISDRGKDAPHLFLVTSDGQDSHDATTRDTVFGYPIWLPGSEEVGYYVLEGEQRLLRKVGVDGGDPQDVVTVPSSFKTLLAWLPDNHVVYYGYSRSGNLAVVNVDTANINTRTPITVSGNIPFLSFSPDGKQAAFTLVQGKQSQLFLADTSCPLIDQCNARKLITDKFNYTTPRFSPDGKTLLVSSDRAGNLDLWMVGLDGTVGQKVPGSGLADYEGVWQP